MKKVNEFESLHQKKTRNQETNNMTAEQLQAEQEKIFEKARLLDLNTNFKS